MTFSEYIQEATRTHGLHPDLRAGQTFYTVLSKERGDLADCLVGTDADPFYNNNNLDKFFEFLLENW